MEGYTKRSGRNRGRSPRYINAEQLPGRQYLVSDYTYSKVLSYRQFSPHVPNPGTLSRVTDASLSTALQAGRRLSPGWSRRGTTLQAAAWAQQSACGFWKTTETTGTTSLKWQPAFRLVKVVFVVVNRQHRVHNHTVVPVVSVVVKTKARQLQTGTSELGYSIFSH